MGTGRKLDRAADAQRVARDLLAAGARAIDEGRPAEAVDTLRAALQVCERMHDPTHVGLEVLERLVQALRRAERMDEAREVQRRVVKAYETELPGDPRRTIALAGLATLCDETGRAAEGKEVRERAVAAVEARRDDEPLAAAEAGVFGELLLRRNEHLDCAERLLVKALRALRTIGGQGRPETADFTVALADVMMRTRRHAEARPLLTEAIPILEAQPIPRVRLALGLMYLGCLHLDEAEPEDALPLFQRSEDLYARLLGPRSPQAIGSRFQRAVALHHQDRNEEAEALFAQVLKEVEEVLGEGSQAVANVADSYADLLEEEGRDEEAAALRARVAEIRGEEDEEAEEGE
jgi:tetratricopeptide (TPR) repeat protein